MDTVHSPQRINHRGQVTQTVNGCYTEKSYHNQLSACFATNLSQLFFFFFSFPFLIDKLSFRQLRLNDVRLSGLSLASSEALGGAPRSWAAFWPLLGSRGNKEVLRRYLNRVVQKKKMNRSGALVWTVTLPRVSYTHLSRLHLYHGFSFCLTAAYAAWGAWRSSMSRLEFVA